MGTAALFQSPSLASQDHYSFRYQLPDAFTLVLYRAFLQLFVVWNQSLPFKVVPVYSLHTVFKHWLGISLQFNMLFIYTPNRQTVMCSLFPNGYLTRTLLNCLAFTELGDFSPINFSMGRQTNSTVPPPSRTTIDFSYKEFDGS